MPTSLATIIDRLSQISSLADAENQALLEQAVARPSRGATYLIGEGLIEGLNEPAPCRAALRGFLEALPENILQALVVLNSLGRDKHADLREAILANRGVLEDRDCCVRMLLHRRKRMEYLHAGVVALPGSDLGLVTRTLQETLSRKRRSTAA